MDGARAAPMDRKPPNWAELLPKAEERLKELGPGPYTPEQRLHVEKLHQLIQRCRQSLGLPSNSQARNEFAPDSISDFSETQSIVNAAENASNQLSPVMRAASGNVLGSAPVLTSPSNVRLVSGEPLGSNFPPKQATAPAQAVQSGINGQYAQPGGGLSIRVGAINVSSTSAAQSVTSSTISDSSLPLSSSWPPLSIPAFESRSFDQLIHETDAQLQLEDELEDAFVQVADDFIEQTVEYAARIAKHRGSSTIEQQDMLIALDRYAMQSIASLPQLSAVPPAAPKRRVDTEAHRQRLALINKKLRKF